MCATQYRKKLEAKGYAMQHSVTEEFVEFTIARVVFVYSEFNHGRDTADSKTLPTS